MNEPQWLDGNALAGLFFELFGTELTDAPTRLPVMRGGSPGRGTSALPGRGNRPPLPRLQRCRAARRNPPRPPCPALRRHLAS